MHRFWLVIVLLALCLPGASQQAVSSDVAQPASEDVAALKDAYVSHLSSEDKKFFQGTDLMTRSEANPYLLVYGTWFLQGRVVVRMVCRVSAAGQQETVRDVYDWAMQNNQTHKLAGADLLAIEKAITQLPPGQHDEVVGNTLILSFRDGTAWVTRTYDRSHLPVQVIALYKMMGAPLDLAPRG